MSGKYDDLERLRDLFHQGVITETEFNAEKEKILNGSPGFDPNSPTEEVNVDDNRSYNSLMHISQFSNYLLPGLGFIVPIVMWATRKSESRSVDLNGKIILNWNISIFIYTCVLALLIAVAVLGFSGSMAFSAMDYSLGDSSSWLDDNPFYLFRFFGAMGLLMLPIIIIFILDFIFTIIGAIKASSNEVWNYPLSIRFFRTK